MLTLCRDLDGTRVDLLAARDVAERASEARGVARCEQLLRFGASATGAAEAFRDGELDVEVAVVRLRGAVAAGGCGGSGGVELLTECLSHADTMVAN